MAQAEERNLKQSFPRELLDQPPSARLSYFKAYTVAHPFLGQADEKVRNTLREPGGALLILLEKSIVLSIPLETNEQRPDLTSERLFASK